MKMTVVAVVIAAVAAVAAAFDQIERVMDFLNEHTDGVTFPGIEELINECSVIIIDELEGRKQRESLK